jgi:AcrR family transcriptional regulator
MARPITKLPQIERTAIRLFASHGLSQVTIKDIAREAKCAEGALYRHYKSKEEMAWALFKREVEEFSKKVAPVWFGEGSFAGRLEKGIQLFYKFFDEDPLTFGFILLSQHDFPSNKKLDPNLNPDHLVLKFVREGIRAGAFRVDEAGLAAAMVLGAVLEPATHHATGKLRGRMQPRSKTVADACLKILKGNANSRQSEISRPKSL